MQLHILYNVDMHWFHWTRQLVLVLTHLQDIIATVCTN